jgi:anaerobic selenocysteine-containing dehydrogenase
VTARPGPTKRYSFKKEQELPNVYVSTETGAVHDTKGGPLRQVTWDEALDLVATKIKAALDKGGPSSIGVWAADHLSPEMNFTSTKLFFAPLPKGLYDPKLGPDKGVAVRAIHNRPKWNSEHPSIADNFGSANTLLYSYHDFEIATTVLYSGTNSYETGTVFYNRVSPKRARRWSSTRARSSPPRTPRTSAASTYS